MRSLVVDDDFVGRKKLEALLAPYGSCTSASKGDLAMRQIEAAYRRDTAFELILLDVNMPDMRGPEVVREIRALEESRGIPVEKAVPILMVSACRDIGEISRSFKEGCQLYITKPVNKKELSEALGKIGLLPKVRD